MAKLSVELKSEAAQKAAEKYQIALRNMGTEAVKTDKSLAKVDSGLKKTSITAAKAKRAIATVFAGLTTAVLVRSTVTALATFEQSMSTLRAVAITANVPLAEQAELYDKLRAKAILLGATTRFTSSQAAEGLLFLARAGFTAQEQLDSIASTLSLASAGQLELGEAADFASNIISQFNLTAAETARVADSLVNVSNRSNTNVRQMAEAMKFAGPVANALGITLETTAAAVGILGDSGIQATMAGTNLRGMLLALVSPTAKAKSAFDELGISEDAMNPAKVGLISAFQTLGIAFDELTDQTDRARLANDIFARRNVAGALIVEQNIEKLLELVDAQEKNTDAANEQATAMEDNLAGSFRSAKSAIEALQLRVGDDGLTGTLRTLTDTFTLTVRELAGIESATQKSTTASRVWAANIKALTAGLVVLTGLKVATLISAVGVSASTTAIATGGMSLQMQLATGATAGLTRQMIILRSAMTLHPILAIASVLAIGATAWSLWRGEVKKSREEVDNLEVTLKRLFGDLQTARASGRIALLEDNMIDFKSATISAATTVRLMMVAVEKDSENATFSIESIEASLERVLTSAEKAKLVLGIVNEPGTIGAPVVAPLVGKDELLEFLEEERTKLFGIVAGLDRAEQAAKDFNKSVKDIFSGGPIVRFFEDNKAAIRAYITEQDRIASKAASARNSIETFTLSLEQQIQVLGVESRERTVLRTVLNLENIARRGGITLSAEEIARAREAAIEIRNRTEAETEALRIKQEETAEAARLATELASEERSRISAKNSIDEYIISIEQQNELSTLEGVARTKRASELTIENLARRANIELTNEQTLAFQEALAAQSSGERTQRNRDEVADLSRRLELEKDLLFTSRDNREIARGASEFRTAATRAEKENVGELTEAYIEQAKELQQLKKLDDLILGIGDAFGATVQNIIASGKSLRDSLKDLLNSISNLLVQTFVSTPLAAGVSGLFAPPTTSAKGNVFSGGDVVPFATGGLITESAIFPLSGRRIGSVRERQEDEAGLPLRRGLDGRLGVDANGLSKSVTVHVHGVTDADSFRKSERQIARALRRAANEF